MICVPVFNHKLQKLCTFREIGSVSIFPMQKFLCANVSHFLYEIKPLLTLLSLLLLLKNEREQKHLLLNHVVTEGYV